MGTTLSELKRKVLMGVRDLTGEDILMAEEAINQACRCIAQVHNFDELIVWDKTSAFTVDGTHRYHITSALLLTRPKDILSIIAHDDSSSTHLQYREPQWMDENHPYPEDISEAIPLLYTQRGMYIELIPIPDDTYPLYIRHSQWPLTLTDDLHECSYTNIDPQIIALSRDIFLGMRAGSVVDGVARAKAHLNLAVKNDRTQPGALPVARGFNSTTIVTGEYWNNPYVKHMP